MAGRRPTFWPHPSGVLQVVTVPVTIDLETSRAARHALTMGYLLDAERAGALKALTGADVAFAYDGTVRASSFPTTSATRSHRGSTPISMSLVADRSPTTTTRHWCGRWPARWPRRTAGHEPPRAVVLRSRTARMQTLGTIRAALAGIALATVALAAVLSYAIARTVTKPLATITAHMRDVAATGDLTRKVALPPAVERRGRHDHGRRPSTP